MASTHGDTDAWLKDVTFKKRKKSESILSYKKVYKSNGTSEVVIDRNENKDSFNGEDKKSK